MLSVHCKVWVEQDGKSVFGDGRVHLLEAIAETESLAAAARRLKMPYRTAWQHLNLMEKAYGKRIVERQTGGPTGGGCRLTSAGNALLKGYVAFRKSIGEVLDRRFQRLLATL